MVTGDNLVGEMPEVERHGMPRDVNHSRQLKALFWIDLWKKLSFPTDLGDQVKRSGVLRLKLIFLYTRLQ